MSGHTPGVWEATERSGYHEILAPDATSDWYGRPNMHAVAYCDTEIDEAEQVANARLIAVAPELLAALEVSTLFLELEAESHRIRADEGKAKACEGQAAANRKLIAKATGAA